MKSHNILEQIYLGSNAQTETFNIESVEWSDSDIESIKIDADGGGVVILDADYNISDIRLNKTDVINLNKALDITPGDLK